MPMPRPQPNDALAAMLAIDEANGVDPTTPSVVVEIAPAAPPPIEFVIERWDDPADGSFVQVVTEPEPPPREDEQAAPAKPTPRLNRARAWRADMMRPDLGGAA